MLRETAAVSLAGVLLGIGGALIATREVSSFLFGLSPRDPVTLAAVSAILLATAVNVFFFFFFFFFCVPKARLMCTAESPRHIPGARVFWAPISVINEAALLAGRAGRTMTSAAT